MADCFAVLGYPNGAILAVADGVNWGEPARRAARCAILGCVSHVAAALAALSGGESALSWAGGMSHTVISTWFSRVGGGGGVDAQRCY